MNFDFGEAFARGMAEWGGTFNHISPGEASIGPDEQKLYITWESNLSYFTAMAGTPSRPDLLFGCIVDGWEAWQAIDAGRDFAKRAYEIAGRIGKQFQTDRKSIVEVAKTKCI